MVHPSQQRRPVARKQPASLTVSSGSKVRTIRLPGWAFWAAGAVVAVVAPAFIAATGYLIFRDDLLGASMGRQVALQYAYEDRIAALRTELDRVTSKHLVETQGVEEQLGVLLQRQDTIARQSQLLDGILGSAKQSGIAVAAIAPLPRARPDASGDTQAAALATPAAGAGLAYAPLGQRADDVITGSLIRHDGTRNAIPADHEKLRPLLKDVQSSLDTTEAQQDALLDSVTARSRSEVSRLNGALRSIGASRAMPALAEGGPYIPAGPMPFVEKAAMADQALKQIATIRKYARVLPLHAPIVAPVSSTFGNRIDPFLGTPALHPGIDFAAAEGSQAHVTAPGTVTSAGWVNGYGQMVEVKHADGVSTRYGHLSQILVAPGEKVSAGTVVGLVGSTGRSTGPHLHYETRQDGKAVDPAIYLAAGRAF